MEDKTFLIGACIISVGIMLPFWILVARGEYQVYTRKKDASNVPIGGNKTKRSKGKRQTYRK